MPNRVIRDGFVDSEPVNALSDWAHRVYSNLLVRCDDAGRFDGRLESIRSHLFPLGTARRIEDFNKALDELTSQSLIIRYEYGAKSFIQITKWQRCGNSERSKFPWKDGVFAIIYASVETKDGCKDFVTTSLMGYAPPVNGVRIDPDTKTGTDTKTKTGAGTGSKTPKTPPPLLESLPEDPVMAKLFCEWRSHETGPSCEQREVVSHLNSLRNGEFTPEEISAEIRRPDRDPSEFPRVMAKRMRQARKDKAKRPRINKPEPVLKQSAEEREAARRIWQERRKS